MSIDDSVNFRRASDRVTTPGSVAADDSIYAVRKGWWSPEQADASLHDLWDPMEHPAWDELLTSERARPTP